MPSENPIELYKYKALEDKGIDQVEDMLANNRIWFSGPRGFNDPFDCAPEFSPVRTREEVVLRMAMFLTRQEGMSVSEAIAEAESKIPESGEPLKKWWQSRVDRQKECIGNSAILCLTSIRDDALMWVHYAGQHKGVCIEFRPTTIEHLVFVGKALPVEYSSLRPIVDPVLDSPSHIVGKVFLTKSLHFHYEEEHRIVCWDGAPGFKPLPPGIVGAVILGCRISPENRDRVRKACAEYNGEVEIVTAQLAPDEFALQFISEGIV